MTDVNNANQRASDKDLQDLIAENDTGARQPTGMTARILLCVAVAWSLFQLWLASPLPYIVSFGVFNSTEARSIHLAFAVFLAFMAYPAFKSSPRSYIPVIDWVLAAAVLRALHLYLLPRSGIASGPADYAGSGGCRCRLGSVA